jgi:hypothetical protein
VQYKHLSNHSTATAQHPLLTRVRIAAWPRYAGTGGRVSSRIADRTVAIREPLLSGTLFGSGPAAAFSSPPWSILAQCPIPAGVRMQAAALDRACQLLQREFRLWRIEDAEFLVKLAKFLVTPFAARY